MSYLEYLPQINLKLKGGKFIILFYVVGAISDQDQYNHCVFATITKSDLSIQYTADNCDEVNNHAQLLCQYDPVTTGK